jgi:hypothetical protein
MIPNILHFCFGLQEQTEPFEFVYALAILSAKLVNNPDKIYFYYHYEPYGEFWDKVKPLLTMEKVDIPTSIGDKAIIKTAHKADVVRMNKLLERGGVYMDIDTISIRPYAHLLNMNKCVLCWERDPHFICNAIMLTEPNSQFFQIWMHNYYNAFRTEGWCDASVILPAQLYHAIPDKSIVTVLDTECFFQPSCTEHAKIFQDAGVEVPTKLLTLHLWESMDISQIKKINKKWISENTDTLYSKLVMFNRELLTLI